MSYLSIAHESSSCFPQRKGRCHSLPPFITSRPLLRKLRYPKFGLLWERTLLTLLMPLLGHRLTHSVPLEKAAHSGTFRISPLCPLGSAEAGVSVSSKPSVQAGQLPVPAHRGLRGSALHRQPLCLLLSLRLAVPHHDAPGMLELPG